MFGGRSESSLIKLRFLAKPTRETLAVRSAQTRRLYSGVQWGSSRFGAIRIIVLHHFILNSGRLIADVV